jgi:DNA-directed RNA polymerase I, II, and III subunit RPABC2
MSDEEYSDIESIKSEESEIDIYPAKNGIISESKKIENKDNDSLDDTDMSDNDSEEFVEDGEEISQQQINSDEEDNDEDDEDDYEDNNEDDDEVADENSAIVPNQVKSKKILEKKPKKKLMILDEEDDEEDEEYNENYLEKFDSELVKNYIYDFHPECLSHNYDEITKLSNVVKNSDGIIIDPFHKTIPYLTKYERARILGQRAKQIETGAKPFVKVPENIVDGYLIAELELKEKKIPFIIKRPIPGGSCEYWNLKDLEVVAF